MNTVLQTVCVPLCLQLCYMKPLITLHNYTIDDYSPSLRR